MHEPDPLLPDFVPWEKANTERYLTANPLPLTFTWLADDGVERPVRPRHTTVTSYGKWLHETPYFPGLFELIHRVLVNTPQVGDCDWLAAELNRRRPAQQQNLTL